MANPYVNKVVINGTIKLDLTADTVDASHLISGYTAHDASGASITGTATAAKTEQTKSASYTTNGSYTVSPDSGKVLSSVSVTVAIPTYDGSVS